VYEITSIEDYSALQSNIMNALNTCIYNIKEQTPTIKIKAKPTKSSQAQKQIEPVKHQ
jgi:hypothetical protein